jgi:UDP-GlcNAc:undecaprenyl-phosphate/decaprenyl-phosphate GlcNAc-1-phosphate transferase
MSVVLGFLVGAVTVLFLLVAAAGVLRTPVLARRNYRDRAVPTAGGLLIVLALLVIEAGRALLGAAGIGDDPGLTTARSLVLFAAFGFGLLGLIDDAMGEGDDRGFRGHVGALFQGRLTTGMLKLVGGGAVAVVLVAAAGDVTGWRLIADALLIALAANLGNLLDRAPGRVIKVGVVVYLPLALALGTGAVGVAVAPVIGAAVGLLGPDLRERLMLGDTGANVIGAVLGLGVVLGLGPTTRTVVLVFVAALNVAAELVSFSRVIERVPALRTFDQLGRTA